MLELVQILSLKKTFKVSKFLKGVDRRVEREEEKQGIAGLGT
jgi:predicted hydrolase (HD superfamily)